MNIPHFEDKRDLFAFLKENKSVLLAEKKYRVKHGDALVHHASSFAVDKTGTTKAASSAELLDLGRMQIKAVINATNIMDSHSDVHFPGLWTKSVKEQKNLYLLEEHRMTFKGIISDEVIIRTEKMSWKDLGLDYEGKTEVLVLDANANKDRNPYMFEQYAKGYVRNHSVGMVYVKIALAVNSDEKYWAEEKEVWDKYIDQIVNRDAVEEKGFFWAVTEAKAVEGSAVPLGSNIATPTISVEATDKGAAEGTPKTEPSNDTQKPKSFYSQLIK